MRKIFAALDIIVLMNMVNILYIAFLFVFSISGFTSVRLTAYP